MKLSMHVIILAAIWPAIATAATHEDPVAGFTIDMPDGYSVGNRQVPAGATILTFERENSSPIVVNAISFGAGYDSNDEFFESLIEPVEEVFGGPVEVRDLSEMDIGGMPARWGWVERRNDDGVLNIAGLGVVELDDQFVSLSIAMPASKLESVRGEVETAFFSIRPHGDTVGEVAGVTPIERTVPIAESLEPSTYVHPLFTVDLPARWQGTTTATEAKKIYLASIGGPTSTITVLCMSGMLASHKVVGDVMQTSLSNNLPNIRQVGSDKVRVSNGKKAIVTTYKGQTESEGGTVTLDGLTASVKNRKCVLGFIAIGPETAGGQGVDTVMEIVQSVR